tara:strand:- start:2782 stop:4890 length:2109 start_codon:yes stop_codon:yes gene_type:complete
MTEGMMGRTSDTRIYNPRSESSEMFRANHEDERPPSGIEDAKSKERRKDKKQAKREREEKEDKKIRHIKVRRHHLGLGDSKPSEDMDEEEEQYKPRGSTDNPANQTMPSGAGGFLSSLAMGAKGPGAAGGQTIQMSEPMDMAWRLLKYDEYYDDDDDDDDDFYHESFYYDDDGNPRDPRKNPEHEYHEENMYDEAGEELKDEIEQLRASPGFLNKPEPAVTDKEKEEEELKQSIADFLSSQKLAGEPMDMAWQLLKMSEAEALHYHHPDIEAQRHIDKKRNVSGHLTGHMKQGLSRKIRQDAIDRAQRNVLAGIPEYLRFAHGTHPEMMRRRAMIPDDKTPLLPTTADERNKIADLEEVARKIKLNPQTVYHQQMYSTQMLPPGPFTEPEPEPEPDIQDSPIPGMAFVNGQLVPDPRVKKSSPMDFAWDMIQKKESKRSVARRRKKEGYAKWRPSTGQFEKPKGGGDQRNITSRRSKNISRNLPMGRKTGLNRSHFSVEFSHRGLASKQPPSKDPQKYRPYLASQDARKLLGGVRTVYTPHMRHSQRSFIAGPTGGGRLTNTLQYPRIPRPRLHAVRAPSIVPPKMKVPRLARPKMPSMITMSEDTPQHSDILKANAYQAALMRIALKEIRELMREKKDKDSKKKGKGEPDTAGAASTLPNYPANNPKQTNRNQGATEDANNEPRDYGLDPGALVGRGSGRV